MKKTVVLVVVLFTALLLINTAPAFAYPQPQAPIYTPTADPSGRIMYIVNPGDSCISISLLTGVSLDQLRLLNNLSGDECNLTVGQQLLLAIVERATPTPGPTPTEGPILPTPTLYNGDGEVCVYLFMDVNGNAMAEEGELPLPGGAVSVADKDGKFSRDGQTAGQPVCFSDIPEGEYTVSVAVPEGYNATTIVNYPLMVKAGDKALLDFGAQPKGGANDSVQPSSPDSPSQPDRSSSPILAIFGIILVLGGIGLGIYMKTHMNK